MMPFPDLGFRARVYLMPKLYKSCIGIILLIMQTSKLQVGAFESCGSLGTLMMEIPIEHSRKLSHS